MAFMEGVLWQEVISSQLSSLMDVSGDSGSRTVFLFRGIQTRAGCPCIRDAIRGALQCVKVMNFKKLQNWEI